MAKKKSRRLLIILLLVLAALVISAVAWFAMLGKAGPLLVSVEKVETRTITQTVSAIGKLQPEFMVPVTSEASGEIILLAVRDGDSVYKGQIVARIQPDLAMSQVSGQRAAADGARLAIEVAKAETDRAQADLKRVSDLVKKDFATREEYDRANAAYLSAKSRQLQASAEYQRALSGLLQSQHQLNRTAVIAPMKGIVTYLAVELGQKVVGTAQMQGTEMMRISDLNTMNAWVDVDENDVAVIQVGDTARISIDALREKTYRGIVYEVGHSPRVSGQGSQEEVVNFQVRIRLIDKDFRMRPGMSCNVDIETETKTNVLSVPIQSVTVRQDLAENGRAKPSGSEAELKDKRVAQQRKDEAANRPPSIVWVLGGNKVQARTVETGISDQGYIEIVKGLKGGETVVTAPFNAVSKTLQNGMVIKVEDQKDRKERFDRMREKP